MVRANGACLDLYLQIGTENDIWGNSFLVVDDQRCHLRFIFAFEIDVSLPHEEVSPPHELVDRIHVMTVAEEMERAASLQADWALQNVLKGRRRKENLKTKTLHATLSMRGREN